MAELGQEHWSTALPDTLTIEHDGKPMLLRDHPFIKETPDVPTLAKRAFDSHRMVGMEKIPIPGRTAKPEDIAAFKERVYQTKIFNSPPASPDNYEFKLDAVPEKMRSDELVKEFRSIAHEEGLSQSAVSKIAGLYEKMFTSTVKPALDYSNEQGQKAIQDLASQLGKSPEEINAYGGAWLAKNLTEEDMAALERAGLANHPTLIKFAAKAGFDTGEDISLLPTDTGAGDDPEYTEALELMSAMTNPKHADYQKYASNPALKAATNAKIDAAFKKKHGNDQYVIS